MIENYNSFKLTKSKNIKFEIYFYCILIIIVLAIGIFAVIKYYKYKQENKQLMHAIEYCTDVYNNAVNYTDLKDVDKCLELLNNAKEAQINHIMKMEIKEAKKYILLKEDINSCFENNILKSSVTTKDIEHFYKKTNKLKQSYQLLLIPLIQEMETQHNKISLLFTLVNNMYETDEKINFKKNLTRLEYNQSVDAYNDIKQEDIKIEYIKYINDADQYLTYNERLEEERKRQREIANAWVKLNVPYISQNLNNVFNGCEAASLLMGLKYKGYLLDTDLVTFSQNMPKSDDPNTGFYLDIFGTYPKT